MRRRLTIHVSDKDGAFSEEYLEGKPGSFTEADVDLEKWANDLVDGFNATLRPHESERKVESVLVDSVDDEEDLSEDLGIDEDEDDLDDSDDSDDLDDLDDSDDDYDGDDKDLDDE